MNLFSSLLELVGLAVLAFGLWMLAPWLGVAAAGAGLIGLGVLLGLTASQREGGSE